MTLVKGTEVGCTRMLGPDETGTNKMEGPGVWIVWSKIGCKMIPKELL